MTTINDLLYWGSQFWQQLSQQWPVVGYSETGATKRTVGNPPSSLRPRQRANSSSCRSVSNIYRESSIIMSLRLASSHQLQSRAGPSCAKIENEDDDEGRGRLEVELSGAGEVSRLTLDGAQKTSSQSSAIAKFNRLLTERVVLGALALRRSSSRMASRIRVTA
jgi:hypothetical protein